MSAIWGEEDGPGSWTRTSVDTWPFWSPGNFLLPTLMETDCYVQTVSFSGEIPSHSFPPTLAVVKVKALVSQSCPTLLRPHEL